MVKLLLIFIGGGLGSALRYAISSKFNVGNFYYGTMAVNILGCFLIGLIFQKAMQSGNVYILVIIGFLGGMTTFSAFIFDSYRLMESPTNLVIYFTGTIILSMLAFALGLWLESVDI